jgi:hypothetical protein
MFKYLRSEALPLTKQLVERFANMRASPTERELDLKRVKHLRTKADHGLLLPFQWAIALFEGEEYRVNGQHSSIMLSELDGNLPDDLVAHIDYFQADDRQSLAMLFRQFDDRRSSRSSADIAAAYQGLQTALKDVPRKIGKLGIDAVAWYNRNVEGLPVAPGDDKYKMFDDQNLHQFLCWLAELFATKVPELMRPTIVAAIYGSFLKTDEAETFWTSVARGGVEYDDNHPATKLYDWLKALKGQKDADIKPANLFQGAVYAWNAHRKGKMISTIRYDTKKGLHPIAE